MELTSPNNIRKSYIETLADREEYNNILATLVKKNDTEPIFTFENLNYEDVPVYNDEQRELLEISLDLNSINNGFIEIKNRVDNLMSYVDTSLETIKESIKKEDERISDINTICGQSDEFNMVVPIYASDFDGDFENINNKYFGAALTSQTDPDYEIIDVSGNGIAGNKFVYNDDEFENEENDYSDTSYITDDNDITKFEYSRYITNDKTEVIDNVINYDQKPVELVLTLFSSQSKVNKISWLTETKDLSVIKLETSDDGLTFINRLEKPVKNQDTEAIYNDSTYIYGADVLCFPYAYYVRITFSSSATENDTIAVSDEDDNIILYPNTLREKITINNIKLYQSKYENTTIETDNIITGGSVDKVGLFASEYIPDHFTDTDYIKYYLIVNGTEYEVVPVNSGKEGTRLIKYSTETYPENSSYISTISENIKSVRVKISINKAGDDDSPYVGNIKLCLGKETESIYV